MRTDTQARRSRTGRSLRALQMLLSCLLLALGAGSVAARPAAPIVMVQAQPAAAAEQPAAPRRAEQTAARRSLARRQHAFAPLIRRPALAKEPAGKPWTTARRGPRRPLYLLRHALLR